MNLAFPALLVVLLGLPGLIFRYSYARGDWGWSSPVSFRSAVVDHGKESYLYRGIGVDWTFDSAGQLDTIILIDAFRRPLSRDAEADTRPTLEPHGPRYAPGTVVKPDARYYQIRGDRFTLRYSQRKTLNLEYFSVKPMAVPVPSDAERPGSGA